MVLVLNTSLGLSYSFHFLSKRDFTSQDNVTIKSGFPAELSPLCGLTVVADIEFSFCHADEVLCLRDLQI